MAQTPKQKAEFGKGRSTLARAETNGTTQAIGKLQELLAAHDIDLADLGSVRSVQVRDWEALAKGPTSETIDPATGKVRISRGATAKVPMHSSAIILDPSWATGPKWPVVQPAKAVRASVPKRTGPSLVGLWKTLLFLPDEQIGYRRLAGSGTFDPFHDPRCIDIYLQIAEAERPDLIIHAGDLNDFAAFSRHRQEPGFAMTVQEGLDYAYAYLYMLSLLCKEQRLISGNHDIRLQNYVIDNAAAAFGVTRARLKSHPPEWPVLSLENLLRLDEINVEYVGAYPAGATYVNDNLAAIHGAKIGNKNRTAAQIVVEDENVNVLYGHTHKRALAAKTRNSRCAPKFAMAYSPGCGCRIDGAVPSTRGQVDAFGAPVKSWEDWQQGCAIIRYTEDGRHQPHLEEVPIFEGVARHRDQDFVSTRAVNDPRMPGAS